MGISQASPRGPNPYASDSAFRALQYERSRIIVAENREDCRMVEGNMLHSTAGTPAGPSHVDARILPGMLVERVVAGTDQAGEFRKVQPITAAAGPNGIYIVDLWQYATPGTVMQWYDPRNSLVADNIREAQGKGGLRLPVLIAKPGVVAYLVLGIANYSNSGSNQVDAIKRGDPIALAGPAVATTVTAAATRYNTANYAQAGRVKKATLGTDRVIGYAKDDGPTQDVTATELAHIRVAVELI